MDEYIEVNRRHWDELVALHVESGFYDVDAFKAGRSSRIRLEREELGDVQGKTLLHLQCHFGLDTLSWARDGAIVTGVDFSAEAVRVARDLASELIIEARFVESDIASLPDALTGEFDIVFTSLGVVSWLPDLRTWAAVIAHFLKPGGTFYILEFHPVQQALEITEDNPEIDELRFRWPYFATPKPLRFDDEGSYADRSASVTNHTNYVFPHSLGDVVTSLVDAGLQLEFLHEFPFSRMQHFPFMEKRDDGLWHVTKEGVSAPLMFSLRARKPV